MAKIDLDFFEKVIFHQCLRKNGEYLAACIEYLSKDMFRNKDIAAMVEIIKNFFLERDVAPSVTEIKTLCSTTQLKNNFKRALEEVKDIDKVFNDAELVSNTEYFLKQRSYYRLTEDLATKFSEQKDVDHDEIQKEMEKIHAISLINNLGLDYFGETKRVVEYLKQKDTFISTGYQGLDDAFGGGLFKEGKAFYCLGGETNVGKSIVLGNVATNVILQDLNVLIFTLEMSEMRYAKRISSMLTGIAMAQLADNTDGYEAYIEDFKQKHTSRFIIKEFATKSVSAKNLYSYTQTLKRKKGFVPHLMIFDYHALLKPSITQPSKHTELQFITQESRGLTYLLGCPGLSVAQLNRGSHKAVSPGLDNASGSWDQISDLDGMVNLWQTDEDREANLIRYAGKKARDGAKGKEGAFNVNYDTLRLSEPERDDTSDLPENNIQNHVDFSSLMTD